MSSSLLSSSSSFPSSHEPQIVQIRLVPAQTADEQRRHIVANIVIEGADTTVPYIDDPTAGVVAATRLEASSKSEAMKSQLRYYSVGPGTFRIRCPLCRQHGDAAVMRGPKMKDASCCLSTLSCFFPFFWLCCLCTWCGCNSEWTTKGLYCNRCGGKLGKQRKVK